MNIPPNNPVVRDIDRLIAGLHVAQKHMIGDFNVAVVGDAIRVYVQPPPVVGIKLAESLVDLMDLTACGFTLGKTDTGESYFEFNTKNPPHAGVLVEPSPAPKMDADGAEALLEFLATADSAFDDGEEEEC